MSRIDERLRLNIHTRLTELLGSDEADAFMAQMLPVHWHDVATKDDLRVLSAELRAEIRADIVGQTRWLTGYVTALGAGCSPSPACCSRATDRTGNPAHRSEPSK